VAAARRMILAHAGKPLKRTSNDTGLGAGKRAKRRASFGPYYKRKAERNGKISKAPKRLPLPFTGPRKRVFELKEHEVQCLCEYEEALRASAEKKAAYESALDARKEAQIDFNHETLMKKHDGLPPYEESVSHSKSYYYSHDSIEEHMGFWEKRFQQMRRRREKGLSRSPDLEPWEFDV